MFKLFYSNLKFYVRKTFDFTNRETNGFLVFSLILLISISLFTLTKYLTPAAIIDKNTDALLLDSLLNSISYNNNNNTEASPHHITSTPKPAKLFNFDPNIATKDELLALGFHVKLAERIINYRVKGGKFYKKEDLKKIYGMDTVHLYKIIYPYIILQVNQKKEYQTQIERNQGFAKNQIINLNTADSADLVKIRGIGPAFATRIIKFRDKLGGFVTLKQLYEVYGLDSNTVATLIKSFSIDNHFKPRLIAINQVDFDGLKTHPYIGYKFAKIILAYRKQHGSIKDVEQLKQIKLFTEKDIEKLVPYLDFN